MYELWQPGCLEITILKIKIKQSNEKEGKILLGVANKYKFVKDEKKKKKKRREE